MAESAGLTPSSLWERKVVVKRVQHELAYHYVFKYLTWENVDVVSCGDDALPQMLQDDQQDGFDPFVKRNIVIPVASTNQTTAYPYHKLPHGHIRILEIFPGHSEGALRCHLYIAVLQKNELAHDAHSSAWSLDNHEEEVRIELNPFISCNGARIKVQLNLHHALKRVCDTATSINIWVDALCINQEDKTERVQQVQMMHSIYTWFQRLWVVQKVALGRSAIVLWGDCEISWDLVGIAAAITRRNYDRVKTKDKASQRKEGSIPMGILNAYFVYRTSNSQTLINPLRLSFHQLLRLTRQFECKENRDKIVGLLAMPTTDRIAQSIVPDYEKSEADFYRNVALLGATMAPGLHIGSEPFDDRCDQCCHATNSSQDTAFIESGPADPVVHQGQQTSSRWMRPISKLPDALDIGGA
ncbi:hypothetical protein EK21DRAFT_90766 [Setomelanomma holmii]|uniref:Heterokaryon incompatibility domain-containing protein n=1 Tax=Setomelanomma holmii TaxID=210430 RepID=A0A9P4H534_9PLEO|nr:hypothetical protein EK21DRAFT_90766 [Setomelanomma holmii]